jgi:hypothetical protein
MRDHTELHARAHADRYDSRDKSPTDCNPDLATNTTRCFEGHTTRRHRHTTGTPDRTETSCQTVVTPVSGDERLRTRLRDPPT